ncbi:hypothetical protein PUN28_002137 [Cardiocondyla obscurior]|uniref:Uncharacterized protein n=1 Tax=Cardiocondyla obscurior TaxID=286306 RepID=A0AAW2GSU2_9HYME
MPKIMKKKCVMAKRASILRRMLHLRQEIGKKQQRVNIENSENRPEFSVLDVSGTSNDLNACENDNIIDNSVTSLSVSTGEITHDNEVGNVIDVFNDDSDGSLLDVREYCINNIFDMANEPNLDKNNMER